MEKQKKFANLDEYLKEQKSDSLPAEQQDVAKDWLLKHGHLTEELRRTLLMYGYVSNKNIDVGNVELSIIDLPSDDPYKVKWQVVYKIKLKKEHIAEYIKFRKFWERYNKGLSKIPKNILTGYIDKKVFEKSIRINIEENIKQCVSQLLGPEHEIKIELIQV